jgi:hypothetical protein
MPLSPRLEVASQSFNINASFLKQSLAGLNAEDWCKRPNDHCNNLCWLVGHLTWSRTMILKRLGAEWTTPWMQSYARGTKCVESPESPTSQELTEAWSETCGRLNSALESASEELLNTPASKPGPPSADGMLSGTINFMALHETYHVGQVAYVRSFLGHAGAMG